MGELLGGQPGGEAGQRAGEDGGRRDPDLGGGVGRPLRESPLERLPIHAPNRTSRIGWIVRGIVFPGLWADLRGVNCGKEMRPMSAEILKRKLRNFPVASLSERIATA